MTLEIRPFAGSDERALLEVWNASMPSDRVSTSLFRTRVLLDSNFHPERLPVALLDRQVVGFILCLTRQVPLFLQGLEPEAAWITAFGVHPHCRGKGVGTALFDHILSYLKADGRKTLDISPYVPNYFVPGIDTKAYPETITYLQDKYGFATLYHAISMGANLTNFQIPPEIKSRLQRSEEEEGLTIRHVSPGDIPELMPFLIEHFGWDWYRHAQSYLMEYFGDSPHQICFLVARLQGEIVGFCQQKNERFGPFGVREDCRGRGIGRMLLFKCLEMMSAQHVFFSYFLWTSEDAARLYARAGFERRREFAVMRKVL